MRLSKESTKRILMGAAAVFLFGGIGTLGVKYFSSSSPEGETTLNTGMLIPDDEALKGEEADAASAGDITGLSEDPKNSEATFSNEAPAAEGENSSITKAPSAPFFKSFFGKGDSGAKIEAKSGSLAVGGNELKKAPLGSVKPSELAKDLKPADKPCFTVRFDLPKIKTRGLSEDDIDELLQPVQFSLEEETLNARSVCVRHQGKPIAFESLKGKNGEFRTQVTPEMKGELAVSYCLGEMECGIPCEIPKDDSLAAALGAAVSGDEEAIGWVTSDMSAEDKNTQKRLNAMERKLAAKSDAEKLIALKGAEKALACQEAAKAKVVPTAAKKDSRKPSSVKKTTARLEKKK